jgi:hypothetical protein
MKRLTVILRTSALIGLSAALAAVSYAQNRERFGISAKAGGINSVIGRVLVKRAGQSSQENLSAKDDLTSGDVVITKGGSRVEVLLNPGSYLRLTENSEFELTDNSLNNLQLRLVKGSSIVEATGTDDLRLQIRIVTDQSRFTIVRRGVYRINVLPGSTELLVQKGRVLVDGQLGMIKGGKKVTFNSGSSFTAKLTKKDRDEFDAWSKERGEFLARANERLSIQTLNSYLFGSGWDLGFSAANRFGLWTYSPFAGGFTFFPFRYGWSSPYGHNYGRCGWLGYGFGGNGYFGPVIVSAPPGGYGGWGGSGGSSGGSGSGGATGGGSGSGGTVAAPPSVSPSRPSQAGPAAPDPGGRPRTRDPL